MKQEVAKKEQPVAAGPSQVSSTATQKTPESPPATSTPGRLPAKKELLSRARQGVPLEMRSPPAHTSIAASSLFSRYSVDDYESDGSASPELGVDDVIPHALPRTPPLQPAAPTPSPANEPVSIPSPVAMPSSSKAPTAAAQTQALKRIPVPPPPHRLPTSQRSAVPVPPPLPQKKEVGVNPPVLC